MTNAQKWISAVLVLFILLLVLSKMTNNQESETNQSNQYMGTTESVESGIDQSSGINVGDLLANNRCFICHGNDLKGTGTGPSLANVSDNWKKVSLISYFQNPKAFLSNPRMAILKDKFNKEMPAQERMTQEELGALAEYLLTR